jgi:protein TonB
MKMVWFFFISALIHSLVFALPVFHDQEGQGNAIPVTLVLGTIKAEPEKTLSNVVNKAQVQETVAEAKTEPIVTVKKKTKRKPIKKPVVKKLAKVRRPKPSKSAKMKKPITIAASPKDVHKEQTERPPEREDTSSHFEIEDFFTPEPLEQEPANGSTMKMAKVDLALRPGKKPATTSPPESELHEATKGVNFLGHGDKASLFVGVRYARIAKPKYPRHARKMGWEGTTLLRVLVNQIGKTKFIEISRSSGFATLDKAAIKAVKRWRFHPARSGDKSVESWVKIPIVFDLEESKK